MKGTKTVLLPRLTKILEEIGGNIRLARLRRKLTTEQIAERAGISRSTLWQIEKGLPSVSLGTYAQVLFILGLEKDLQLIAKDDVLGRKLQDADLSIGKRASKK
ncbi:helix-turn-helix transcriptional regulator [Dysgonomonas sp. GY75]|uniref:helix-turn-helix domain-containing protein n=1 Tax=Dysgonomonas sp. GY75 TaxID=2780419 RepID=UPI001884485D|nr:helix-turn-helix transcriptional regulator [Dysgonomonas sp. GY75]MBF0650416.1 helix-turn-helix transcriptional regulator [Dysgonomonas sp. GY75]